MPKTLGDITQELNDKVLTPAKDKADEIVSDAEKQAAKIVADARAEAEKMKADAKADAEKTLKQLEVDMNMAARDFILTIQEKLEDAIVTPVVEMEVRRVLEDPENIKNLIEILLHEFLKTRTRERRMEVLLSDKNQDELEDWFLNKFREKAAGSVTIQFTDQISFGFQVGMEDQDTYLNFGTGLVESFVNFLSPRFRKNFFGLEES